MHTSDSERRKYQRILFKQEESIIGVFMITGSSTKSFTASILNVSAGGLQLAVRKSISKNIKKDDVIILTKIEGPDSLLYNVDLKMNIKWIVAHRLLDQTGYGCEFIKITEDDKIKIEEFLETF